MSVVACRSCGMPCVWAESEARPGKPGKPLLIDADEETGRMAVIPNGNLIIVPGQRTPRGSAIVRYVPPGDGLHRAHFATCVNAEKHRRNRP